MKELEFTCGGGLMQAVQSWGCILNVVNNYQSTFNGCVSNFNNTITQNPNALCQAAQDLTNCFRFPYIVTCGGA
uniref:Uncharacterized protein n=1 Tax=Plectus sambesii TaxID=2011161 RepID=A0A914VRY5_9BILA